MESPHSTFFGSAGPGLAGSGQLEPGSDERPLNDFKLTSIDIDHRIISECPSLPQYSTSLTLNLISELCCARRSGNRRVIADRLDSSPSMFPSHRNGPPSRILSDQEL